MEDAEHVEEEINGFLAWVTLVGMSVVLRLLLPSWAGCTLVIEAVDGSALLRFLILDDHPKTLGADSLEVTLLVKEASSGVSGKRRYIPSEL